MDSAFLSGTSLKVLPIKNIEEKMLDTKQSNLLKIINYYDSLIDNYIEEKLPNQLILFFVSLKQLCVPNKKSFVLSDLL